MLDNRSADWRSLIGIDEAKFNKLPQYVRAELERLARDLAAVRQDAIDILDGEGPHRLVLGISGTSTNLPESAAVRFRLGDWQDEWIEVRVDRDDVGSFVHLYCGTQVAVEPRAANNMRVRAVGVGSRRA